MKRTIVALLLSCCSALAEGTVSLKTAMGEIDITIQDAKVNYYSATNVTGFITNRTTTDIERLAFDMVYLDKGGKEIDICPAGSCSVRIIGPIRKGATVPIGSRVPGLARLDGLIFPQKSPTGRKPASVTVRLSSADFKPQYAFEVETKETPQFDIRFSVDVERGISFDLKNKLESPIEILWDQSSFIDERDESGRVIHATVKYIDKEKPMGSTVVPPLAKVSDTVFPTKNIAMFGGKWDERPLLPTAISLDDASRLAGLVGRKLKLYLRMVIEDKKVDYLATFTVKAVGHFEGNAPSWKF